MKEIIGQQKLLNQINSYTKETLPKTLMFIGELGCGKHLFTEYIANKFNLEIKEIEDKVTHEDIVDYSQSPIPTMYIINLKNFTDKQQNQFLKFIEEPAKSVYISILTETEAGILPTILNRCIKLQFEPYTKEQLQKIGEGLFEVKDELMYEVCSTPGQIISNGMDSIKELYQFCDLLVHNIKQANWANTLKISTKINYKDYYDKFDFYMFFKVLEKIAFNIYLKEQNEIAFKIYLITNQARKDMINKLIVKEDFVINFLMKLWEATR